MENRHAIPRLPSAAQYSYRTADQARQDLHNTMHHAYHSQHIDSARNDRHIPQLSLGNGHDRKLLLSDIGTWNPSSTRLIHQQHPHADMYRDQYSPVDNMGVHTVGNTGDHSFIAAFPRHGHPGYKVLDNTETVRYRKRERSVWTSEEDEALTTLVKKYGSARWTLIARELKKAIPTTKKDNAQCSQHWRRVLSPRMEKASGEEDENSNLVIDDDAEDGGHSEEDGEEKKLSDVEDDESVAKTAGNEKSFTSASSHISSAPSSKSASASSFSTERSTSAPETSPQSSNNESSSRVLPSTKEILEEMRSAACSSPTPISTNSQIAVARNDSDGISRRDMDMSQGEGFGRDASRDRGGPGRDLGRDLTSDVMRVGRVGSAEKEYVDESTSNDVMRIIGELRDRAATVSPNSLEEPPSLLQFHSSQLLQPHCYNTFDAVEADVWKLE